MILFNLAFLALTFTVPTLALGSQADCHGLLGQAYQVSSLELAAPSPDLAQKMLSNWQQRGLTLEDSMGDLFEEWLFHRQAMFELQPDIYARWTLEGLDESTVDEMLEAYLEFLATKRWNIENRPPLSEFNKLDKKTKVTLLKRGLWEPLLEPHNWEELMDNAHMGSSISLQSPKAWADVREIDKIRGENILQKSERLLRPEDQLSAVKFIENDDLERVIKVTFNKDYFHVGKSFEFSFHPSSSIPNEIQQILTPGALGPAIKKNQAKKCIERLAKIARMSAREWNSYDGDIISHFQKHYLHPIKTLEAIVERHAPGTAIHKDALNQLNIVYYRYYGALIPWMRRLKWSNSINGPAKWFKTARFQKMHAFEQAQENNFALMKDIVSEPEFLDQLAFDGLPATVDSTRPIFFGLSDGIWVDPKNQKALPATN